MMDWVLSSAEILSTFSKIGYKHAEGYHLNEGCNEGLQSILQRLSAEDEMYRMFRRSIGFGQHVQRDIIPILLASKEDNTTELLIKILVNLTIPTECIISLDSSAKTNDDRHMIFEINNLLQSTKSTFTDKNVTKVVMDYLKKNAEQSSNLSGKQITNVMSCLQLLRNVLHIPEATRAGPRLRAQSAAAATVDASTSATDSTAASTMSSSAVSTSSTLSTLTTVQNQIIWNIFSQSIDKILIKLINIPGAESWCVDMVQLVALMYKDQQDATLHRLLDDWLQIPPSETTDVESNTSPPKKGNEVSTPVVTSVPESLDTAGSGNCEGQAEGPTQACTPPAVSEAAEPKNYSQKKPSAKAQKNNVTKISTNLDSPNAIKEKENAKELPMKENQATATTSSNDTDQSPEKQTHEKPLDPKRKPNTNPPLATSQELRKTKLKTRAKANISNVQGMFNNAPTNDDISQVMKEFTVDFLLRGYNILVKTLHNQILTNHDVEIDTAHFFWLVSYFLKFATQLEMEMKQLDSVLSFEIVSYLTAESVNLCEQFELAIKNGVSDRRPLLKRLHLIVAAMREFVQAVDMYKTQIQLGAVDQTLLDALLQAICEVEELRLVFVLLLRHYNPQHQTREYLQDLVVANHQFIIFLESLIKTPKSKAEANITAHLKLWTDEEIISLNWHYLQCEASSDVVGDIVKRLREDGVTKSRESVLNVLHKENLITKSEHERLSENYSVITCPKKSTSTEINIDEVDILCDQLKEDGRGRFLLWLQMLLLETCFVKLYNEKWTKLILPKVQASHNENSDKSYNGSQQENSNQTDNPDISNFALFKRKKQSTIPLVSPVVGHFLTLQQSVPVVPWNSEQAAICKDLKFLQLMHRLGFQMPVDSGKVFIRVPCVWSAEQLYELAGKVGHIDSSKLKFSVNSVSAGRPSLFTRPDRNCPIIAPTPSGYKSPAVSSPPFNPNCSPTANWLDFLRRSKKYNIPMDLKRKIVEQCTEENGDECKEAVDELHKHKRFMHNEAPAAAGAGRFMHSEAPAAAGAGRFMHSEAPGAGRFMHNEAPAVAGAGRFMHSEALAVAGAGRFMHSEAPAAPGAGRFMHSDAPAASRFMHSEAPAAPGAGRFMHSNAPTAARFMHSEAAAAGRSQPSYDEAAAAGRSQASCDEAADGGPRREPTAHAGDDPYGSDTICDSDDDMSFSDSASVTATYACMNDSDDE